MSNKTFENLTLEGGGVRGFAYCGAIQELENQGVLNGMKRFSGTSVGALFAALLACDFTASEIMESSKLLGFSGLSMGFCLTSMYNIWHKYGLNSLCTLEKQFRTILKKKVDPDITLKDLYDKTGKDLVMVACCISRQQAIYFHHVTFPDVKLINAILTSISVPFLFQPHRHSYFGTNDYYIDGGLVDNYPIWVFNDMEKLREGKLEEVNRDNISPKTLGLKLLCKNESNTTSVYTGRKDIKSIIGFGTEIINTLMMQIERADISQSYIQQTIPIPTGSIYFLDFNLSDDKINVLIKNGQDSVKKYFR